MKNAFKSPKLDFIGDSKCRSDTIMKKIWKNYHILSLINVTTNSPVHRLLEYLFASRRFIHGSTIHTTIQQKVLRSITTALTFPMRTLLFSKNMVINQSLFTCLHYLLSAGCCRKHCVWLFMNRVWCYVISVNQLFVWSMFNQHELFDGVSEQIVLEPCVSPTRTRRHEPVTSI